MELLLNLLWSMLALLALGLWRNTRLARNPCRLDHVDQFVLLGCVLILLFPVVSATDDLHPLRQEVDESGSSKRFKHAATEKQSTNLSLAHSPVLHPARFASTNPLKRISDEIVPGWAPIPKVHLPSTDACRAPPMPALSCKMVAA